MKQELKEKRTSLLKNNYLYNPIIFLISVILFFIPLLFWFGGKYYVGGDDTMLYYLFPKEMINNYIFNIISTNGLSGLGSFAAQWYFFPFVYLIEIIKSVTPGFNTQLIMYGLNLSLGFFFFYLLIGIWIKNSNPDNFLVKIIASLSYAFSIFSFYSLWSGLTVIYLVSIFPLCSYLFIRSVIEKKIEFIFYISIILSIFSVLILAVPWVILSIIGILPTLIILLWKKKLRLLLHSFILLALVFLYNFYWIFYFLYPHFFKAAGVTDLLSSISSSDFITAAENTIKAVTGDNNLIYPLFNLFHKGIQASYGWQNYKIFTAWHEKFLLPFAVFLIFILAASFYVKKASSENKKLYISSLISWLLILYFFTIKIGENFGLDLFLLMNRFIPGFTMFRNAYGKISPALPFSYALLIGISLKLLIDNIKSKYFRWIIIIFAVLVVVLNAIPFIFNDYYANPIWTTKNTFLTINNLNKDFFNLTSYISHIHNDSNFIWIPLSIFGYVPIQDQYLQNHYYSGLSPVEFLAGKTDLAGTALLPSNYSSLYIKNLSDGNFSAIGEELKSMNVNYIIVNKNISKELQNSYLYTINKKADLFSNQGFDILRNIVGYKIKSFGNRYDLYKIKNIYQSDKIFVSSNKNTVIKADSKKITYHRIWSYQYNIDLKDLDSKTYLIFLDPFNPYWKLYIGNPKEGIVLDNHILTFGFANGWIIDKNQIKAIGKGFYKQNADGTLNLSLTLYFEPQKYFWTAVWISVGSVALSVLFLGFIFITRKFEKSFVKRLF